MELGETEECSERIAMETFQAHPDQHGQVNPLLKTQPLNGHTGTGEPPLADWDQPKFSKKQVAYIVGGLSVPLLFLLGGVIYQAAKECLPGSPAPPVTASCPMPWVRKEDKCYFFSATEANWTHSQSHCASHGGSLVTMETPEERDFVKRQRGHKEHWIGFQRESPSQPWMRPDGSLFNNSFTIGGKGLCAYRNDQLHVLHKQATLDLHETCPLSESKDMHGHMQVWWESSSLQNFDIMAESLVADHMTQLKLKLLEKKLENEHENLDDLESVFSEPRNYNSHDYALQNALKRRKDLLQQLREQKLLEECSLPQRFPGIQRKRHRLEAGNVYEAPFPLPEQPRIIQQTLPQQPATIIQQIPQHPLITQIPPPQPSPVPRSGSIKEDMVEMMLMQNAQMHQIIMQNMMLKSLPLPAYSPASGPGVPTLQHGQQLTAPMVVKTEKSRPSTVHHHHYTPASLPAIPSQFGFSMWPSAMLGGFPSDMHHMPIPASTAHTVQPNQLFGLPRGL